SAATIRLGVGLAAFHHISADEAFRRGQASCGEASEHQPLGGGGNDRPAVRRQLLQKFFRAWKNGKIGGVGDLEILNRSQAVGELRVIELRLQYAQDVDGALAVRDLKGIGIRDVVYAAPLPPTALDRANRANEDTVHIEEQTVRVDNDLVCALRHKSSERSRVGFTPCVRRG